MRQGWISNYCGLGGEGPTQHAVDEICKKHDEEYQDILDDGQDPYSHWNYADRNFLASLKRLRNTGHSSESINEWLAHVAGKTYFEIKHLILASTRGSIERPETPRYETESEEETKESFEDLPSEEMMIRGDIPGRTEHTGSKRKRTEEHGMEPAGHGNTPATGTEQAGYIPKYVPLNFPDKFTIKERYCETYAMHSIATAAGQPNAAYLYWNTNSNFAIVANSNNTVVGVGNGGAHQPNQRDNWSAQWGFYRVESMEYKIHVSNTMNAQYIQTLGSNVSASAASDAIVTLLPTQTNTDITAVSGIAAWEQKQSHNVYLQARSPGSSKTYHVFTGMINPEDFDIDPLTTASDETWTAVGASPATNKVLGLEVVTASPYNTTLLLPETQVVVFVEFVFIVQYAGYKAALRQTPS